MEFSFSVHGDAAKFGDERSTKKTRWSRRKFPIEQGFEKSTSYDPFTIGWDYSEGTDLRDNASVAGSTVTSKSFVSKFLTAYSGSI